MNHEPTLASIPGILLRTAARNTARVLFVLSAVVLLLGFTLTACSLFVCMWRSPRPHKIELLGNVLVALTALAKDFR